MKQMHERNKGASQRLFPAETVERWVQTKPEGIQELFKMIVVHQSVH